VPGLSKDQALIILDYADAILRSRPALQRLIEGRDADSIRLTNGVEIACFANSFRLVRGPTVVCAIMDEVAVWWSSNWRRTRTRRSSALSARA
jgi:hypothetical protein